LPDDPKPEEPWPTAGAVSFENVQLRYRPDLPLVLKGLTFNIKPGQKIGIIGRTGAGKSSIAQALFRTVELCEGRIVVDGKDLRNLGLTAVRSRLAIIPQDAFLFGGTVRENIDPTGVRTDAELNDAMGLVHRSSSSSAALKEKFKLEGIVATEGSNFSAGERQLRMTQFSVS
jgi:ABC-type multidrug transport system fused ATPase/permease subunit